jgi:hypothetical protein
MLAQTPSALQPGGMSSTNLALDSLTHYNAGFEAPASNKTTMAVDTAAARASQPSNQSTRSSSALHSLMEQGLYILKWFPSPTDEPQADLWNSPSEAVILFRLGLRGL